MESFREDFDLWSGEILAYLDLLRFIEQAGSVLLSNAAPANKLHFTSELRTTYQSVV